MDASISSEQLLNAMTLAEKISLLAGSDLWHTTPIERLGIPALKMTDGPNGARGGTFVNGVTAACFPAGVALASTWNLELVERVGQALAQETKTKGARVLLAPTINIHRSPLAGRNFECFSEDPYLSARMAVAYVKGVQSEGVGATIKHFVCNDSEFERHTISSEVGERALREIYLAPFQAAVQEASPWLLMAAYNVVNGIAASEHPYLLTDILRKEWGFDGLVVSDWYTSVKSTAPAMNAGLDLEMPGPGFWRGEALLQAVQNGEVAEATIDESVRRLLLLLKRAGSFEHSAEEPEQAIDRPEHRALTRLAAAESLVLLKNAGQVLPLQHAALKSIAIIGPNARTARIMAGGSAQVNPHYQISPLAGIAAKVGDQVTLGYEPGCATHKQLPLLDPDLLRADVEGNEYGLKVEYFANALLEGTPDRTALSRSSEFLWLGSHPTGAHPQPFSMRATASFLPQEAGPYTFSLSSAGLSRLLIDGQEVIDNWTRQTPGDSHFGMGSTSVTYTADLEAGRSYALALEYSKGEGMILGAIRLGCLPPQAADALERAVALAGSADIALVFAGLNHEWESEGFDRVDMNLPGEQNALIERVAAANKNTVVVLNSGAALAMPWLDQVAAVLQAWYPGQECGNAIADVLFGDINPSGKLTQTFPVRLEDNPAYLNYPGENGKVLYGEGLFVGYRYYEKKCIAPLFPFGFGLSYTTFAYSGLHLSAHEIGPQDLLHVSFEVTNTGARAGKEVAQVYVRDSVSRLHRPPKELKAFAKVELEPGERKTVTLTLDRNALACYDDLERKWVAEAGEFEVLVGSSSQDIRAQEHFVLTETCRFTRLAAQEDKAV
ncbi:MAG TPA: glycoside hydrolase family 3 C-terminal domain-containing protein [Ktedonobacteraceae bacterium]|nr:glycoside hydrolase family 3 C-terminal domain-containing protein [Ktedonobacteraceae bacterium]